MVGTRNARLLTFNCHEGYVHLLGKLGLDMDVVDGLPGRYTARWDERMRPVPRCARLIQADAIGDAYDVVIAHNVLDLLLVRHLDVPKILVLHVNLAARAAEEPNAPAPAEMSRQVAQYLALIGGTAVAVSSAKRDSWGLDCDVIRPAVDANEWSGYRGTEPTLLRVANQVGVRRRRFAWPVHERIVEGLPFKLVGHNPDIPGSEPARSWADLRDVYRASRAYVHTADPSLEDGYNLAVLEAMATGMPVVANVAPESPVIDGVNGFINDDAAASNQSARALIEDAELARRLGANARESVLDAFGIETFIAGWHAVMERARETFHATRNGVRAAQDP